MNPTSTAPRRGVMLLLVLMMLGLFLLVGTLMIVLATRARTASRAFAESANTAAIGSLQSRAALDEALLVLLRGSGLPSATNESILQDKYGSTTVTGTMTFSPAVFGPIVTGTLTGAAISGSNAWLNGRILTVLPAPHQGQPASYRIAAAQTGTSGAWTLDLANIPQLRSPLLTSGTYRAVINGREFVGEPHDSTSSDPWLARVDVSGSTVRASYGGTSGFQCDNDNDGIADGIWLHGVVPDRPSPRGGTLRCEVSYLVLDLDGRINVNAAGMARPATGSYGGSANVPLGMGYGPADVDASLLFPATWPATSGLSAFTGAGTAPTGTWWTMLCGGATPTSPVPPRIPPRIGSFDGRYGPNGQPGTSGTSADDTEGNQETTLARYPAMTAGPNAVADLKARSKVAMETVSGQLTPRLTFRVPEVAPINANDPVNDYVNDPYESRLDFDIAAAGMPRRNAPGTVSDDSPFTPAELERVLRCNDADAAMLPQRLAAAVGDQVQSVRTMITTDSWDTPALTGLAAQRVEAFVAALAPPLTYTQGGWNTNPISPDVAAGLRFNINRPVLSGTAANAVQQQQDYCKGLYTLARALGETDAKRAAQWAVNVLDVRDDDSTMTRFEYDDDLANGWQPSASKVVWGVERPELLIAETAACRDTGSGAAELFVNLVRPPWTAVILSGTAAISGTTPPTETPTEVLHPSLAVPPPVPPTGNPPDLDLAKTGVWQVRFDTGKVVQFGAISGTTSQSQSLLSSTGTVTTSTVAVHGAGTKANPLAPGGEICLQSPSPTQFSVSGPQTFVVASGGTFAPPLSLSGTFTLERLADPTRPNAADNPYVVVDTAPVTVIEYTPPAAPTLKRSQRPNTGGLTAFWKQPQPADWTQISGSSIGKYPTSGSVAWFHWPNRPFISQAELALVPADNANDMLKNYSFPTTSLANTGTLGHLILDATMVPSRFAGNAVTLLDSVVSGTTPLGMAARNLGLDRLGVNHFSKWREPGRVNVNTIPCGPVVTGTTPAGSPISGRRDDHVWAALTSRTQTNVMVSLATVPIASLPNPFCDTGLMIPCGPATSVGQMLSLSAVANQPIAQQGTGSGPGDFTRDRNPFFALATAIRLANTATVRSNVFAVWITVRISDDSADPQPTITRRLFAIVDRSIPVGYSKGENLNVRDTIRLQRFLD